MVAALIELLTWFLLTFAGLAVIAVAAHVVCRAYFTEKLRFLMQSLQYSERSERGS